MTRRSFLLTILLIIVVVSVIGVADLYLGHASSLPSINIAVTDKGTKLSSIFTDQNGYNWYQIYLNLLISNNGGARADNVSLRITSYPTHFMPDGRSYPMDGYPYPMDGYVLVDYPVNIGTILPGQQVPFSSTLNTMKIPYSVVYPPLDLDIYVKSGGFEELYIITIT